MGLRYSYRFFMKADQVTSTLKALPPYLDEKSGQRVRTALPWRPATDLIITSLSGSETIFRSGVDWNLGATEERDKAMQGWIEDCLTFLIPKDEALRAYEADTWENAGIPPSPSPSTHMGCIYINIMAGENYAVVDFTAATSNMSLAFERSKNVRRHFVTLAGKSNALAMYLDTDMEPEADRLLYPDGRKMRWLNWDDFSLVEQEQERHPKLYLCDVDAGVLDFLLSARLV